MTNTLCITHWIFNHILKFLRGKIVFRTVLRQRRGFVANNHRWACSKFDTLTSPYHNSPSYLRAFLSWNGNMQTPFNQENPILSKEKIYFYIGIIKLYKYINRTNDTFLSKQCRLESQSKRWHFPFSHLAEMALQPLLFRTYVDWSNRRIEGQRTR